MKKHQSGRKWEIVNYLWMTVLDTIAFLDVPASKSNYTN